MSIQTLFVSMVQKIKAQFATHDSIPSEKPALIKAYLAGFDVFRPDSVAFGETLKRIALVHGVEGHYPLDNVIGDSDDIAGDIAEANMGLIRNCDIVIANMNDFRGYEPDSGTAFEVGFAVALKKPVFLYTSDLRPMLEKVPNENGIDENGFSVEDFNLPLNLMHAKTAAGIYPSFIAALVGIRHAADVMAGIDDNFKF